MDHTHRSAQSDGSWKGSRNLRTFPAKSHVWALMAELDRAAICARIQQAREEAGLTQPELGEMLEVHWRTVQSWENAKSPRVPWKRLDEIGRVTGVTKEWLLHGDDQPVSVAAFDERLARIERVLEELVARLA